ncbi:MAG: N-6 DNA methylase [Thermoguttaceae bacterium]
MQSDRIKSNGVHYTPAALAEYLAAVTAEALGEIKGTIEILDPACGDGALLSAFARQLPRSIKSRVVLHGYETDLDAIQKARILLADIGVKSVNLMQQDFLSLRGIDTIFPERQVNFLEQRKEKTQGLFDAIIANPPYVRTQVLGAAKAQELAKRFRLTGRVDLYQAFSMAIANVLKPGGVLGLLTSNRFLTVKSGATLRQLLRREFELNAIYDLGDTKLFSAAVLPVIVVAKRNKNHRSGTCLFDRVYECRSITPPLTNSRKFATVLNAFQDRSISGIVATEAGLFKIERGVLQSANNDETWSLSTPEYQRWLQTVEDNRHCTFENVSHIRVGIKTTADNVFIRDDWDRLNKNIQPEKELLRPLISSANADKWIGIFSCNMQRVLYPHTVRSGKRIPVDLKAHPCARAYLEFHREQLSGRKYVTEAGRQWYEIWVPHNPTDWVKPKIVFPDIAKEPRFFFDSSGAVVNGNCYWITLRPGFDMNWLYLILAIANSSFITKYYDLAFHNKLYAGRRRFMTQYVRMFPLPDLRTSLSKEIIELSFQLVSGKGDKMKLETKIDNLVWRSFGLVKEVGR